MGRQTNCRSLRVIGLALLLVLILGLPVQPILAADPAEPDTFQILSVQVCRHVAEQDDFILVFHYVIHYDADQPGDPASRLFHFKLMDSDGSTQLGAISPYPYHNSGYDQGASAFYFSASDAPTWEQAYVLKIEGNPQYWADPPVTSYNLVTSDYSQLATQEENRTLLGNYILDIAADIEIDWDTQLLTQIDNGTVLSATGETYFRGTISGIQSVAPQIFAVQEGQPDFTGREWTGEKGEEYTNRYEGTWVGDALKSLENTLHVDWNILTGMGILGLIVVVFAFSQWRFATTTPGLIAGSLIFLMGSVMGWVAPAVMAVTTLLFGGYISYVLFFRYG